MKKRKKFLGILWLLSEISRTLTACHFFIAYKHKRGNTESQLTYKRGMEIIRKHVFTISYDWKPSSFKFLNFLKLHKLYNSPKQPEQCKNFLNSKSNESSGWKQWHAVFIHLLKIFSGKVPLQFTKIQNSKYLVFSRFALQKKNPLILITSNSQDHRLPMYLNLAQLLFKFSCQGRSFFPCAFILRLICHNNFPSKPIVCLLCM